MDYGYILRRAWQITRQHKVLWLFGFLAALRSRMVNVGWRDLPPEAQRWVVEFASSSYFVPAVVGFVLLALLVGLGMMLLNALGKSALVEQVNRIENGGASTVRTGWEAGKLRARRVFLLVLLLNLPLFVIGGSGAILFFLSLRSLPPYPESVPDLLSTFEALGFGLLCFLPAACLSVLLWVPLSVIQRLAVRACVLEDRPVWSSIARGWEVLRGNFGVVAALWLILFVVGIGLFFFVVGVPLGVLAIAFLTPLLLLRISASSVALGVALGVTVFFWLVGAAVNGVVETFISASWTLAYRQLTGLGRTGEELAWT